MLQNPTSIAAAAQSFSFTSTTSLRFWLAAANTLLREASLCRRQHDFQRVYFLLMRHAELILSKLPTHPEYKKTELKREVLAAQKQVGENLAELEGLKARLTARWEKWQEYNNQRTTARREDWTDNREAGSTQEDRVGSLNAPDHKDVALQLVRGRGRLGNNDMQLPRTMSSATQQDDGATDDLSERMRDIGRLVRSPGNSHDVPFSTPQSGLVTEYRYPIVAHPDASSSWRDFGDTRVLRSASPFFDDRSVNPPTPPAKSPLRAKPAQSLASTHSYTDKSPPPLPSKIPVSSVLTTSPYGETVHFKPTAFTEAGAPLRTLFLPPTLRATFLSTAVSNTRRNLETCGILAGTLIANALYLSHLIIPSQTSTSDTCETTEEGEIALFDYIDKGDLLVMGWIHTHPSQTCFLSSRDLHSSAGYQVMLPESISIVCAPSKQPSYGVFRLTDPPGLGTILNCSQTGLFHPHATGNLYTEALRPGHVTELPGLEFETVDLR
ncbi:hypothetical protein LTR66_003236 [Elasticomyces elasticus]|nr:hypothetical protein LTR66_003236 [Elasticomyces elasticus]